MVATGTKQIISITVETLPDDDADLSYLGKYSNQWEEGAIERKDRTGATYRYFIPAMSGAETGNPESPQQDFERMEAYNRNYWGLVGIQAKASIVINGVCQRIGSGGLWGIESDSGQDYLKEVAREQLDELTGILENLGFAPEEISAAEVVIDLI